MTSVAKKNRSPLLIPTLYQPPFPAVNIRAVIAGFNVQRPKKPDRDDPCQASSRMGNAASTGFVPYSSSTENWCSHSSIPVAGTVSFRVTAAAAG